MIFILKFGTALALLVGLMAAGYTALSFAACLQKRRAGDKAGATKEARDAGSGLTLLVICAAWLLARYVL